MKAPTSGPLSVYDLYWLTLALADEYTAALRARFPRDADYIRARYSAAGVPRSIEAIYTRACEAHAAWKTFPTSRG